MRTRRFCRELAEGLGLPFHEARVDLAAEAKHAAAGKAAKRWRRLARRLRYGWFRELMAAGSVDAVATAHTLDDQAETVLAKFLRGAWTEGLGGIHPVLEFAEGRIVRPLLGTTRAEIEAYLGASGAGLAGGLFEQSPLDVYAQPDPSRAAAAAGGLESAAAGAPGADGRSWRGTKRRGGRRSWTGLAKQFCCRGRPVRGGGRAAGDGLARRLSMEVSRLAALAPAVQRRLLRHAAGQLGRRHRISAATEALRMLALDGRAGQKTGVGAGVEGRANSSRDSAGGGGRLGQAPAGKERICHWSTRERFPGRLMRRRLECGCGWMCRRRRRGGGSRYENG